jgi:cobyrinic acid a,c-diamide synthase
MSSLPRLALGTIQPEAESQALLIALLDALESRGVETQTFLSRACFKPHHGASKESGRSARHLDSWLMTPEVARQVFVRSGSTADLALVEGRYDQAIACECRNGVGGGSLNTLCDWLDLPRIAAVDVSLLQWCRLPHRPAAERLLLDQVSSPNEYHRWQTVLESLWGIPVIGGLSPCTELRQKIAALPAREKVPSEWGAALSQEFLRYTSLPQLMSIASRRGIPSDWPVTISNECSSVPRGNVRVAVAYDEAFHCYFPETLDTLELRGATFRVFSPLRDGRLPPETDIVYLGCGSPHEHAAALAENQCMLLALKEHVCSGRRIYAEGGGLAYLCQQVESPDGQRTPMVGALQAVARRSPERARPEPAELTLAADSWLGTAGTKLRGYRNRNWTLEPTSCLTQLATGNEGELDIVGRHQVIGSRLHLNFAAQPNLLCRFLQPCPAALAWTGRTSVR